MPPAKAGGQHLALAMRNTHDLSPEAQYEIARARAGNVLFCPLTEPRFSGLPPLYEDSAHLMRLLVAAGIRSKHASYHDAIVEIAAALTAAIEYDVRHTQCAEYLLYRLEGVPDPRDGARRMSRMQALIGTFYGNLLIARSVARR